MSQPFNIPLLYLSGSAAHADEIHSKLSTQSVFEVITVSTVEEALEQLSKRPDVQCMLLSYDLPESNGISFLTSFREKHPEFPVVLYPEDGSKDLAMKAVSADATEYIELSDKTTHIEELIETIRDAIDNSWQLRMLQERVKELQAIQQITEILSEPIDRPLESILEDVITEIPQSFQYPTVTEVQLRVGDSVVATEGFIETDQVLTTRTFTANDTTIQMDVCYTVSKPQADESPFLAEERALCDTLLTILKGSIERRTYLENLRESELLFRQLAENINEVAWISSKSKDAILFVNSAYEDVWGQSIDSLYKDSLAFLNAVHPEDKDRVRAALSKQALGEYDEEYRIVRHNLRNELNIVISNAELISTDETAESVGRYARRIIEASKRLMAVADKQRAIANQLTKSISSDFMLLNDIVEALTDEVSANQPSGDITVILGTADDIQVPSQISTALEELLSNAFEHTTDHRPKVTVETRIVKGNERPQSETDGDEQIEASHVIVTVTDNGPGISMDEIERLGGEEEALIHGSGVGLWLVYWLVSRAGGTISFDHVEPQGTRVTLTLPEIKRVE